MDIKELKELIKDCKDDTKVFVFALTEGGKYRPFENISATVIDECSLKEEFHLDISVKKEYKSIHFPNNPVKENIDFLLDKKMMLLEELEEINSELGDFK